MRIFEAVEKVIASDETVLTLPVNPEALATALGLEGYQAAIIDRAPVFNKETLLHGLYQHLQLPAYFGFNWDALEDVLRDASWQDKPLVLIFKDFGVLEERAPEVARTFQDIIQDVAKDKEHLGQLKLVISVSKLDQKSAKLSDS